MKITRLFSFISILFIANKARSDDGESFELTPKSLSIATNWLNQTFLVVELQWKDKLLERNIESLQIDLVSTNKNDLVAYNQHSVSHREAVKSVEFELAGDSKTAELVLLVTLHLNNGSTFHAMHHINHPDEAVVRDTDDINTVFNFTATEGNFIEFLATFKEPDLYVYKLNNLLVPWRIFENLCPNERVQDMVVNRLTRCVLVTCRGKYNHSLTRIQAVDLNSSRMLFNQQETVKLASYPTQLIKLKVDWLNNVYYALTNQRKSVVQFQYKDGQIEFETRVFNTTTSEMIKDYALDPINGFMFIVIMNQAGNDSRLVQTTLPSNASRSSELIDSNRFKQQITGISCQSARRQLDILFANNTLFHLSYQAKGSLTRINMSTIKCSTLGDSKSHVNGSGLGKLFATSSGAYLYQPSMNDKLLLLEQAKNNEFVCHWLQFLQGRPLFIASAIGQPEAFPTGPPRNLYAVFFHTKAIVEWEKPSILFEYQSQSAWSNWRYQVRVRQDDGESDRFNFSNLTDTRIEIGALKPGHCYHVEVSVDGSNQTSVMTGGCTRQKGDSDSAINLVFKKLESVALNSNSLDQIATPIQVGCIKTRSDLTDLQITKQPAELVSAVSTACMSHIDTEIELRASFATLNAIVSVEYQETYQEIIVVDHFLHPFHDSIEQLEINLDTCWLRLTNGHVYTASLDRRNVSLKPFWLQLEGVDADLLTVDHSTYNVYFRRPGNKWFYKWSPNTVNNHSHLLHGRVAVMLQTRVEDASLCDGQLRLIVHRQDNPSNCQLVGINVTSQVDKTRSLTDPIVTMTIDCNVRLVRGCQDGTASIRLFQLLLPTINETSKSDQRREAHLLLFSVDASSEGGSDKTLREVKQLSLTDWIDSVYGQDDGRTMVWSVGDTILISHFKEPDNKSGQLLLTSWGQGHSMFPVSRLIEMDNSTNFGLQQLTTAIQVHNSKDLTRLTFLPRAKKDTTNFTPFAYPFDHELILGMCWNSPSDDLEIVGLELTSSHWSISLSPVRRFNRSSLECSFGSIERTHHSPALSTWSILPNQYRPAIELAAMRVNGSTRSSDESKLTIALPLLQDYIAALLRHPNSFRDGFFGQSDVELVVGSAKLSLSTNATSSSSRLRNHNKGSGQMTIIQPSLDQELTTVGFAVDLPPFDAFYTLECLTSWSSMCRIRRHDLARTHDVNDLGSKDETLTVQSTKLTDYFIRDQEEKLLWTLIPHERLLLRRVENQSSSEEQGQSELTSPSVSLDLGLHWFGPLSSGQLQTIKDRVSLSEVPKQTTFRQCSSNFVHNLTFFINLSECLVLGIDSRHRFVFSKQFTDFNAGIVKSATSECPISDHFHITSCSFEQPYTFPHNLPVDWTVAINVNLNRIESNISPDTDISLDFNTLEFLISFDRLSMLLINNNNNKTKTIAPSTYSHSDKDEARPDDQSLAMPLVPNSKMSVNKVYCSAIPGSFTLHCHERFIHFFWIPPIEPITRAMPKFKRRFAPEFTTMSHIGMGDSRVHIRNATINSLQPNEVYEFGMNIIYENNTIRKFPAKKTDSICACRTLADKPEKPVNLRYHYLKGNEYFLEWTPGPDNGSPIDIYQLETKPSHQYNDVSKQWKPIEPYNLTNTRAYFNLDAKIDSAVRLRALNAIGPGEPALVNIKPPLQKLIHEKASHGHYQSMSDLTGVLIYSLVPIGVLLIALLIVIACIYRRRNKDVKAGNHSLLMNFGGLKKSHRRGGGVPTSGGNMDSSIIGFGSDFSALPLDSMWNQEVNSLYGMGKSDLVSFEQINQISIADIRFERYIGCGAFGKVWEGWLRLVDDSNAERFEKVALKVRNSKSLTEAEFRREATLMHRYQHPNIVRFYGVSFDSPHQQCLVLEMMDKGNLRDYLHAARPRLSATEAANMAAAVAVNGSSTLAAGCNTSSLEGLSMQTTTSTTSTPNGQQPTNGGSASTMLTLTASLDLLALTEIMRDIAEGCKYLEEQHFVHRDIAARNCLVSHSDPSGRIVKLCDFGLARDIYKDDCYRKRNEPKLPVRWMSPEAIRDGLFTTKSDVWAFAVTCWEVMTLGADPFYGRANVDVMNLVIGGHVLGRPENCPEELYNQMLQCWSRFPEMRPSFALLASKMDEFHRLALTSGSQFSGPFIVSLPLPKCVPDSSNQQMFVCSSSNDKPTTPNGTQSPASDTLQDGQRFHSEHHQRTSSFEGEQPSRRHHQGLSVTGSLLRRQHDSSDSSSRPPSVQVHDSKQCLISGDNESQHRQRRLRRVNSENRYKGQPVRNFGCYESSLMEGDRRLQLPPPGRSSTLTRHPVIGGGASHSRSMSGHPRVATVNTNALKHSNTLSPRMFDRKFDFSQTGPDFNPMMAGYPNAPINNFNNGSEQQGRMVSSEWVPNNHHPINAASNWLFMLQQHQQNEMAAQDSLGYERPVVRPAMPRN